MFCNEYVKCLAAGIFSAFYITECQCIANHQDLLAKESYLSSLPNDTFFEPQPPGKHLYRLLHEIRNQTYADG